MLRYLLIAGIIGVVVALGGIAEDRGQTAQAPAPPNPNIDMNGHLRVSQEAAKHRETHRVSEADFITMSEQPGTIILDARSKEKFDMLHIKGAMNLSFPDITVESLKK